MKTKETMKNYESYISVAKETVGIARATVLKKLWELLNDDKMKITLGDPQLGFVEFLLKVILYDPGIAARNALGCCWYLSRINENKQYLASRQLGLIPILITNLTLGNDLQEYSFNILINCSLDSDTHDYLLSDEVGYLDFCRREIIGANQNALLPHHQQQASDPDPYVAIANVTTCISSHNLSYFIKYRFHEIILTKLFDDYGVEVRTWHGRSGGIVYWCLNFLIDFTCHSEGCHWLLSADDSAHYLPLQLFDSNSNSNHYGNNLMKSSSQTMFSSLNMISFFVRLFKVREIESLKALCILCNLCKYELNYQSNPFPQQDSLEQQTNSVSKVLRNVLFEFPYFVPLIIGSLGCTLDSDGGPYADYVNHLGFVFGIFSMKVLTNALKILCLLSIENASLLYARKDFLKLLKRILLLFLENKEEIIAKFDCIETAGGGKDDFETINNTLETLYLLLQHEDNEEYRLQELENQQQQDRDVPINAFQWLTIHNISARKPWNKKKRISGVKTKYGEKDLNFPGILDQLLQLPSERQLPQEARIFCNLILAKLH